MKRRYFGTDGIRAVAGEAPLTANMVVRLGQAAAQVLGSEKFYLGRDTRHSGNMLSAALSAGLMAQGAEVRDMGIVPTPAVAYACWQHGQAGIVISASHNPFADNGIKFFDSKGEKLSDSVEADIEAWLEPSLSQPPLTHKSSTSIGRCKQSYTRVSEYLEFLAEHTPQLSGMKLGIDCAHGAAYALAQKVFERTEAELHFINVEPDGSNINTGCGSTHPQAVQQLVKDKGLDAGIAFDGDADRCLLVDKQGRLVTGDHMLAMCALARGDKAIVSTVMGNMGAEVFLQEQGIQTHRAKVGDRYVKEMLKAEGLQLGGEQSGHILFLDHAPTGDGMFSALQTLEAVRKLDKPLEAWLDTIPTFPQILVNVRVNAAHKKVLVDDVAIQAEVSKVTTELAGKGRVNLRPSGTEALIRVMVEGQNKAEVERLAEQIAAVVRQQNAQL